MNKEKLQEAINALQDGAEPGPFNDELATLLSLVLNTSDECITAAWSDVTGQAEEA